MLALVVLCSCLPPARKPLATVAFPAPAGEPASTLIVLLPGRHNDAAAFDSEGFIAAVQRTGLRADIVATEAHFGYYARQTLVPRLHEDVIVPARSNGYRRIWLVGVSMGGLGALWYDMDHPGEVAGVVALSPYLGDPPIHREITAAGGLALWEPVPGDFQDYQRIIWRRLKRYQDPAASSGRVFVGYGRQDRFAPADALFAAVLPPEQVFTVDGDHDWPTWRILWERILPRLGTPHP